MNQDELTDTEQAALDSTQSGLTPAEQEVCDHLLAAWGTFAKIPGVQACDIQDFVNAIHVQQRILATRALARIYPEYWRE